MKKLFTFKHFFVSFLVLILLATGTILAKSTNFTSFSLGIVNYEGTGATIATGAGYTIPSPYGSLWTTAGEWGFGKTTPVFDQAVKDDGTGNKVWRMSNAVTSTSFSFQPNSLNSPLPAGKTSASLWNDRGSLINVGTTWETYYRVVTPTRPTGTVDALMFRASSGGGPVGSGLYINDVVYNNMPAPPGPVNVYSDPTETTLLSNHYTIQDGINAAVSGNSIRVDAGSYTENININKSVTLNGPNAGIAGTGVRGAEAILLNCSIDVNNAGTTILDGLHIKRTDAVAGDQILLDGAGTNTVQNCIIERLGSVTGTGIRALTTTASGGTKNILNNKITGDPISLFGGHKSWNNAIYINGGTAPVNISGNTIMNSRTALSIDDYTINVVTSGNTLNNNGTHIGLGGTVPTSGQFVMGANNFINNVSSTMVNCSNVNTNFRLDITSSTLNGVAFNTLTNAQLFDVEARVAHKTTGSKKGKVTYVANTQYVNNFTVPFVKIDLIQNSVLYAEVGNIINLQAGTYAQRVVIDKSVSLQGVESTKTLYILDGTGLAPNGAGAGSQSGIVINSGITNTTIKDLTVQNFTGISGNNDGAIYGILSNNNLTITNVALLNNPTASGFYANGPVDNVSLTNSMVTNNGSGARGMVIWNGLKTNINFSNNMLTNNSCCGIELSDGNASGVTITGNTIDIGDGDNAIGLVGLNNSVGANTISSNIITGGGRFGIEIKNPAGGVTLNANSVTLTTQNADMRDRAGIAIFTRGVTSGNVDVPNGVTITGNTVTGYQQASASEGFGIVVEGTNHTVTGNTVSGCDVGILQQQNSSNYPGDADQTNLADLYFGRGNSPMTCGNAISVNTFFSNTLNTRNIGVGGGIVTNTTSLESFCSIQSAINDAQTLAGHTLEVSYGNYNEQVLVNKSVVIKGIGLTQPVVDFTGVPSGKLTLFDISADAVTIDNIHFNVDLSKLSSAIIASAAGIDNISIKNNIIDAYGTPAPNVFPTRYTDRNAVSINYGGVINYRVATGGVDNVLYQNNTVNGTLPTSFFRAAIAVDEGGGTFTGNTAQTINHDVLVRFGSNGPVTITNNICNGGGIELDDMNAGAGTITCSNNTFNGAGAPSTAMLRIRNNFNSKPHVVSSNTFNGFEWGVSLENMDNVSISNNSFTPKALSITYHAVTVNTKLIASNPIGSFPRVTVSATVQNNTFNGSGAAGGSGVTFLNHDNAGASFGAFNVTNNSFDVSIANAIQQDGQSGASSGSTFPLYGVPVSIMAPWTAPISGTCNWFGTTTGATIATKLGPNVSNIPWLTSGVDLGGNPNDGFQPSVPCATCMLAVTTTTTLATCSLLDNGSATVTVTPGTGTGPYTYLWSPGGQTTSTATGLVAGSYSLTVTDVNGCTATATGVLVSNSLAGPVHNLTTGLNYCTIQAAINAGPTNNADIISVDAGTYNENVVVNKSLTLRGPNNLISPNGGARVAEAIISGGLSVDNSANRTIIIEGFHFQGVTSPLVYNGNTLGTIAADFTFRKNLVNNLSGQLAVDLGTPTNSAMVVLDDNNFVSMSGNAIQLNGGTGTLNATVTNNSITGTVTAGINTNGISTSTFDGNTISNTGQQGIQVAGTASNVTISNNVITNANTSNAADRGGIRLRGGSLTGFVNITNNIISGSNNGIALPAPDDITGKSINVNNNDLSGNTKSINHFGTGNLSATCNWYGSTVPATIAAIISGPVNYIPWLTSGVDLGGNPNDGFQPSVPCVACNVVLTATPSQIPCFGGTSSVSLSATGGTGVYTFGGDVTTNLIAGTYNYTVTDANGCSAIQSATIDAAPAILSATVTATQPTCNGTDDGIIAIDSPTGGSGLFEYSIDGGSTWTATINNTGLEPGTYNVQIRDENQIACVIDLGNQVIAYPAVLNATVASTNGTCIAADNGTITVSDPLGGGSATYEFRLDGGAWQTSGSFTPLANGTYSVQMRDAVNTACELTLGNKTITNNGVPPTVTIAQSNPSAFCQGGAIILTANASAGVTYQWSPGGATTQSINVYTSGTYSVTVTKTSSGCTATANIVVTYVASNLLSNYTILVKEQVWIEKNSYVQSGGVGNTYTGAISSNKIWVNDASTITGAGTFARAKFIDVEAGSTVSNPIPTASPVAFPTFVPNPTPTLGSNISVADNAIVMLHGTLYKDITVGKNATLTFTAAFVNIRKLTTKDKSKVTFTSSSELRINDKVDISTKNQFNPTMQTVIVYANSDVDIDKGTTFNGSIYSLKTIDPKGGNKSDERITMNGLFLAKEMHAHYATFNSMSCSGPSLVASFANVKEEELTTEVTAETIDEATPEFKVNVYPNPSSTDFTIQVISKSNEPVTVMLMDSNGAIRSISEVPLKASNVKVGGTLWPGTYFAEVVQGLNKKVVKLIKIN